VALGCQTRDMVNFVAIWNHFSGKTENSLTGLKMRTTAMIQLSDNLLATASWDRSIKLWDLRKPGPNRCIITIRHIEQRVCHSMISICNGKFACESEGKINIYKINGGVLPIKILYGHTGRITKMILSQNKEILMSASIDQTIKIWDLQYEECIRTLKLQDQHVEHMVNWNDEVILCAQPNFTMKFWNIKNGKCLKTLWGPPNSLAFLEVTSGGMVVSASSNDQIQYWYPKAIIQEKKDSDKGCKIF